MALIIIVLLLMSSGIIENDAVSYEDQITYLQSSVNRIESIVLSLKQSQDSFSTRIDAIEEQQKKINHQSVSEVAFSAYIDSPTDFGPGETVVFPAYRVNVGDHYDETNGIFTCPLYGFYYVSFAVHTLTNDVELELVRDGTPIAAAAANSYYYDQGSISLMIPCNPGGQIWLRNGGTSTVAIGQLTERGQCIANAFSAFLLHEL